MARRTYTIDVEPTWTGKIIDAICAFEKSAYEDRDKVDLSDKIAASAKGVHEAPKWFGGWSDLKELFSQIDRQIHGDIKVGENLG